MFNIVFNAHRAVGPIGGFSIGNVDFVVDLTVNHTAGGTKDAMNDGIEALDVGSKVTIHLNPVVQSVEMDVLASASPWTVEFFDSSGISLAVRPVAPHGRKLLNLAASSIAKIECKTINNEAYIYEMRGN